MTLDEVPVSLRQRLPEFLLYLIPPSALAALSVADLEEYAAAYESGELRFVNETRVAAHSGPLEPELAILLLQVPPGAPFIESRFIRIAKRAYGMGAFSGLQWVVNENADGSVDIQLYYASRASSLWAPELNYNSVAHWIYGVRHQDYFYGGQDRQLEYGAYLSELDPEEPRVFLSWTDNTVNNGRNSYSASASVGNDWRRRLRLTDADAEIRQRIARLDASYTWNRAARLGGLTGGITLGAGFYGQDSYVIRGDPTADGTRPRSDFSQTGRAGYVSLAWSSARRDQNFTPREGWHYVVRGEQHLGDFPFSRFTLDLRRYLPVRNVLGYTPAELCEGELNDVRRFFPTASLAFQVQVSLAEGDVPYSQEVRLGNSSIARGFLYDGYAGTKLLAARAEYRFALDPASRNEAFIFTDHAWLGEDLSDLEAFNSAGLGAVFTLPLYGGVKLGAYHGWSFDDDDKTYGLAFGYQF